MEMRQAVELLKRYDEHSCVLSCSHGAPLDYLIGCVDEFKSYLIQRKEEQEKKAEEAKQEASKE